MKTQTGMTQYIFSLVMEEFNRIDELPADQFDKEYPEFNERVRGMYGRPDCETTTH
jgi:hypothetical protein